MTWNLRATVSQLESFEMAFVRGVVSLDRKCHNSRIAGVDDRSREHAELKQKVPALSQTRATPERTGYHLKMIVFK